jgi:hypothetical protein
VLQEKGRKPKNGGNTMNEKTRIQIEEMKRQTIGVEVEMNNITRENAARFLNTKIFRFCRIL